MSLWTFAGKASLHVLINWDPPSVSNSKYFDHNFLLNSFCYDYGEVPLPVHLKYCSIFPITHILASKKCNICCHKQILKHPLVRNSTVAVRVACIIALETCSPNTKKDVCLGISEVTRWVVVTEDATGCSFQLKTYCPVELHMLMATRIGRAVNPVQHNKG